MPGELKPCVIGQYCQRHEFVHGWEAEHLRQAFERLADKEQLAWLSRLLDDVDARDSCAYIEAVRSAGGDDPKRTSRAFAARRTGTPEKAPEVPPRPGSDEDALRAQLAMAVHALERIKADWGRQKSRGRPRARCDPFMVAHTALIAMSRPAGPRVEIVAAPAVPAEGPSEGVKPHIHFFWKKNVAGKMEFGFCKVCGAGPACEECRGRGSVVGEMGCFGPKSFKRCRSCRGTGLRSLPESGTPASDAVHCRWTGRVLCADVSGEPSGPVAATVANVTCANCLALLNEMGAGPAGEREP